MMIPSLAAARAFVTTWKWPLIAGALCLLLLLAYCQGRGDGRSLEQNERLETEIKTLERISKADERAADERISDTVTIAEQKKELDDAIQGSADPDELRTRRGCIILRQQGADLAAFPACRRYSAGG